MIDDVFRNQLAKISDPLVNFCERRKVTPNTLTFLGFAISCLASFFIFQGELVLGILSWWLSRLFDGIDGILARKTGQVSELGGFFDILLDMAAYGLMVMAFAFYFPEWTYSFLVVMFLYVLCITGALALGAAERKLRKGGKNDNRSFRLAVGLAEGGETGIFYSLLALLPSAIHWLLPAWIFILSVTVIARLLLATKELS